MYSGHDNIACGSIVTPWRISRMPWTRCIGACVRVNVADVGWEVPDVVGDARPIVTAETPSIKVSSVNREVLKPLKDLGQDAFRQLITMFLEEATLRVARLRVVQEREDAAAIAGLAHTLKGSGAAFGAGVLAALCAEIEDAVSAHNMTDLARLVDAVAVEFNRVKELLTEELR